MRSDIWFRNFLGNFGPFHGIWRECRVSRGQRNRQWVHGENNYRFLPRITQKTHVNSYCSRMENCKHTASHAANDALTFCWKVFRFYGLRRCGKHNTENHIHIFLFALIIIKQRERRPSAKHIIETFSEIFIWNVRCSDAQFRARTRLFAITCSAVTDATDAASAIWYGSVAGTVECFLPYIFVMERGQRTAHFSRSHS